MEVIIEDSVTNKYLGYNWSIITKIFERIDFGDASVLYFADWIESIEGMGWEIVTVSTKPLCGGIKTSAVIRKPKS